MNAPKIETIPMHMLGKYVFKHYYVICPNTGKKEGIHTCEHCRDLRMMQEESVRCAYRHNAYIREAYSQSGMQIREHEPAPDWD